MKRKALFLDRDGIINEERNYIYKIEDFVFQKEIFAIIDFFSKRKFLIFIITNQAGIAKGKYTETDFDRLNSWMLSEFEAQEIKIDKVYYCPHHPKGTIEMFKRICECRKPGTGMIIQAQKEFNITLTKSILLGDKESDIMAGINAGIVNNYLIKSHPKINYNFKSKAKHVFANHEEFLKFIQESDLQ